MQRVKFNNVRVCGLFHRRDAVAAYHVHQCADALIIRSVRMPPAIDCGHLPDPGSSAAHRALSFGSWLSYPQDSHRVEMLTDTCPDMVTAIGISVSIFARVSRSPRSIPRFKASHLLEVPFFFGISLLQRLI